jgi:pyrroloquinoline quinone (PQQ) biosynthesis protein C
MVKNESKALLNAIDHDPHIGSVIRGDASREQYIGFLVPTFHYIGSSGPLLARTEKGVRRSGRYPWLLEILASKVDEESPHPAWVLNDLANLGVDIERVQASPAPIAVHAYVHFCQTMAKKGSPGFLGAAYALEFISMHRAKMATENLLATKGIPNIENAVSFLDGHGDADPGHVALLDEILQRIEDPADQADIILSARAVRHFYLQFFGTAL